MNIYNPKHSKKARRRTRHAYDSKPEVVREPFVMHVNTGKAVRPKVKFVPKTFDVTAEQKLMHSQSESAIILKSKTHGAFGGVTKQERKRRAKVRLLAKGVV